MSILALTDRRMFDRFCESVEVDENTGCWNWIGALFTDSGRGVFAMHRKGGRWQRAQAHRASYEMFVGTVPAGLVLDHLCNNKICVAPEHLEPVLQSENRRRQSVRQTHCRRGHPLSGANLYTYARGGTTTRHCRHCRRIADRLCDARARARKEHA